MTTELAKKFKVKQRLINHRRIHGRILSNVEPYEGQIVTLDVGNYHTDIFDGLTYAYAEVGKGWGIPSCLIPDRRIATITSILSEIESNHYDVAPDTGGRFRQAVRRMAKSITSAA